MGFGTLGRCFSFFGLVLFTFLIYIYIYLFIFIFIYIYIYIYIIIIIVFFFFLGGGGFWFRDWVKGLGFRVEALRGFRFFGSLGFGDW